MTSLFHTTVQTGPVEFEVSEVHCTKVSLGSLDNNSYLLHAGGNSPLLLIDAATEPRRLLGMMAGRPLGVVVSTHRHADHPNRIAGIQTHGRGEQPDELLGTPAGPEHEYPYQRGQQGHDHRYAQAALPCATSGTGVRHGDFGLMIRRSAMSPFK